MPEGDLLATPEGEFLDVDRTDGFVNGLVIRHRVTVTSLQPSASPEDDFVIGSVGTSPTNSQNRFKTNQQALVRDMLDTYGRPPPPATLKLKQSE